MQASAIEEEGIRLVEEEELRRNQVHKSGLFCVRHREARGNDCAHD